MDGALLINKPEGITSFGVIEALQEQLQEAGKLKRSELPKLGHGGTLDPFATGLLVVCSGRAVKLARYFLGASKGYAGVMRFGETTASGDPTTPVTETSSQLPESIEKLRGFAEQLTRQPYLQTPSMYSAKKHEGRPLYELARKGIEVEREPKLCRLFQFEIQSYADRLAEFQLLCSSGTYVRTLAQDLGRMLGGVALLQSLVRTRSGAFSLTQAQNLSEIGEAVKSGEPWNTLPCWIPFDRLLEGQPQARANEDEASALLNGKQSALFSILRRSEPSPRISGVPAEGYLDESCLAIYLQNRLIAIARKTEDVWGLERVFPEPRL